MKRNFLKRTMALTVAIAMTVSSVPANLAFAEEAEIIDVVEESSADAVVDTVGADTQAPAEEVPFLESSEVVDSGDIPSEISTAAEIQADEVVAELNDTVEAQSLSGTETDQFAITDLKIDAEGLHWTMNPNTDFYGDPVRQFEFAITDDKGRSYFSYVYGGTNSDNYTTSVYPQEDEDGEYTGQYTCSLSRIYATAYTGDSTNGWTAYQNANGNSLGAFNGKGLTYTVQIRAGARIADETSGSTFAVGKFSNAATYTLPAAETPMVLSNVTVTEDGELSATSSVKCDRYEIQIKDAVNPAIQYFSWDYVAEKVAYATIDIPDDLDYLAYDEVKAYELQADGTWLEKKEMVDGQLKSIDAFQPGHGYVVSVRGVNFDADGNPIYANTTGGWSAEVPYTVKALETAVAPGQVTGLRTYLENGRVYVAWDSVAKDVEYDVRVTDGTYTYFPDPYDGWSEQDGAYLLEDATGSPSGYALTANRLYAVANVQTTSDGTAYIVSQTEPEPAKDAAGKLIMAFDPAVSYTFQVRAHRYSASDKKEVYGAWSAALGVKAADLITPQLVVNGLALIDKDGTMNDRLVWDAEDGLSYKVEITDTNNATGVAAVRTITTWGGSYGLSGCEVGHTYSFRVCATDAVYGVDGAYAGPISYAPSTVDGDNSPLDAVTGLTVKTDVEQEKDGLITSAKLEWNPVTGADYYELIIESAGYTFLQNCTLKKNADGTYTKEETLPRRRSGCEVADFAGGLKAYEAYTPGYSLTEHVNPATNKAMTAYDPGCTYTVRVQAVRTYEEWDPVNGWVEKKVVSAPSNPVEYTVGVIAPITDLAYVEAESKKQDDSYYFTYTADPAKGSVFYQISRDENFADCNGWSTAPTGVYKLAVSKEGLIPNTLYYIRAVNSVVAPTEAETAQLTAAYPGMKTSFTTDAERTPAAITGLKLYKEYEDSFEFRFDASLESKKGDHYELQYAYAAPDAATSWRSAGETTVILKSALQEGVNYVRAVAYIVDQDGIKKYGTPSGYITVTLNTAPSALTSLAVKRDQEGYVVTFANTLREDEYVELEVADSAEFVQSSEKYIQKYYYRNEAYERNNNTGEMVRVQESYNDIVIPFEELTPGTKYYVRARVRSTTADTSVSAAKAIGPWTAPVSISTKLPKISVWSTAVTSTSLQLSMSLQNDSDYLTGYQIQRKSGTKWLTLAYTTDSNYQDGGLKSDTKYSYRVRPYYYAAKKYTYGPWKYEDVMTWGAPLNLIAKAASKKSVKLAWDKVTGADGYEIYRMVTSSAASVRTEDDHYADAFSKMELIKTITKSSTKAYVDKNVKSNLSYSYMVRAYKTVNKKKYYISDSAYVDLSLNGFEFISVKRLSSGKVKVKWNPVYTASGYLIEKRNNDTGKWEKVTTKKAKVTSYTFKAASEYDSYRIRAYKGSDYSDARYVTVAPYLAAPTNVKAVVKDGGIQVTWKAVKGADYYTVYRTTSSKNVYDKEGKYYSYTGGRALTYYVEDASRISGYRVADPDELTGTTFVDKAIAYTNTTNNVTNTLYAGPEAGVQYYYYVVAHRKGDAYVYADDDDLYDSIGLAYSGGSAAASAMVSSTKVAKPTSLKLTAAKGKVTAKWKKVKGVDGYVVYRSTSKKSGYVPVGYVLAGKTKKGKKTAAKTSYADTTVTAGKTYYYKVRAFKLNEAGAYTYSDEYKTPVKVKAK